MMMTMRMMTMAPTTNDGWGIAFPRPDAGLEGIGCIHVYKTAFLFLVG